MQAPIVSVPVSNPPFFDDNPFFLHAPKNTPQMGYTMPIRLMVDVLMLKHLYCLGDEKIPFAWESITTFPTDAKLCKKVIDKCNDIAKKEGIKQRQKYKKESKQLLQDTYNGHHPKRIKKSKKAKKTTSYNRQHAVTRAIQKVDCRTESHLQEQLELYTQAVNQQKNKLKFRNLTFLCFIFCDLTYCFINILYLCKSIIIKNL
jgi:hypothetical protein